MKKGNRKELSAETRRKMSESHKGLRHSEETREKMSRAKARAWSERD